MCARPISVCDHCGTHSRTLQACTRCSDVLYCNRECQRVAWREHHRAECAVLRRRRQYESGELWPPRPFACVAGNVPLLYTTYLIVINAFAEPGPYERATDAECGAPPGVVETLRRLKCDVRTTIASVRTLFTLLTNQQLPTHSVLAWTDIHAPPALAWTRSLADNDEAYVASWHTTRSQVVARDARGKRIFRVTLRACTCCAHEVCVIPILNGSVCLVHEPEAYGHDELRALDFLTPHSSLDVFTAMNLLTFSCTDAGACECLNVPASELLSTCGNFMYVAAVRATLTHRVVDVVALIAYHPSVTAAPCAATFSLESQLLTATTLLTA